MRLKLNVWRQSGPNDPGRFETYDATEISPDMSFLEMLDVVNERILADGGEPIAFDHDCREGICGSCGMMINGVPHGPKSLTTVCQLHMRTYSDGDELWIEPFRARAFPVLKDLYVDRTPFDRIIQAGGYISVRTGSAQDANADPIRKSDADAAFDAAACIGCGACVAACPNASAMLFTSAKIAHLAHLPQGQAERYTRVLDMVDQHDDEGFGNCTNHGACENACPKGISVDYIAQLNRDHFRATVTADSEGVGA
ncbi:MAG: succinate dehydrogenase/fumarate reductase iron-sulfur subunit [Longimicrobiales bacterium]|nr:succinate dehydrogenase/fumarate reductase iron-sulfur subunit [Longimicrobiales bacterium]